MRDPRVVVAQAYAAIEGHRAQPDGAALLSTIERLPKYGVIGRPTCG